MKYFLTAIILACTCLAAPFPSQAIELSKAGTYHSGIFGESAAEAVAYDKDTASVFVVNAHRGVLDILNVADIKTPVKSGELELSAYGKTVNSVAAHSGLIAVAVEAEDKQAPGMVVLANTSGEILRTFSVGPLPDMVTFTPDGRYVLCANEGEPNDSYTSDPEGSLTVIDLEKGVDKAVSSTISFVSFNAKRDELKKRGVRISYPKATVAQDLEPEYIAVSADSKTAYVSLQENNALAIIDIASRSVKDIVPLGLKDWEDRNLDFDASDKDRRIKPKTWPVFGCYMPDGVATFTVDGKTYVATANEGESRKYGTYSDELRFADAKLSDSLDPIMQEKSDLGRLKTVADLSDVDGDGRYDRIVAFGGRSFSIWDEDGKLVWDSGDDFAKIIVGHQADFFNADNTENRFDDRSDDRGCEPEAIATGVIDGRIYVFVGLEQMGGIMVYDVTNPRNPQYVEYRLDRNFEADPGSPEAGDSGPEGIRFVPASESHTGTDLLIVGSEVSGTTTIYEVKN